ncbi:Signal peptidase complex catalytic subunit [Coemansia sp. RSA 989]|uniref:Signal peptidase complex catalytic subunit SEC11 n=1 Tax=Coemansia brasiliensis TaxID=2650707 RepID=A0A9W8I4J2_9FUNG|nr:signal peptidase complex catalytic subunit SEC11C-like protein [Coemansia mojavensis]KAJ1741831.1 Signal peptidase complex catalytic subunit [Coemansia sp. RSA 1086]KAJ1749866.1 Signal peptidase complex catalytic subunit [Coemansia sp. RSA 1821]KAJ1864397.1 Signal peptidase complex catalytic subunit [Coemansia sp. RSA 989]KAJ1874974.1 Signal peptidase complex catalytic subunit [Coemansia sp. RSA 990]KAJ2652801.1 Signal peptidase complex catalytic subunit [Coemansia sp. RSA 1250]KAJ2675408.
MDVLLHAKKYGVRSLLLQGLTFLSVLTSAFMIWKGLALFTNSESPVVVVLSGSMEPAYYRGDILFLHNGYTPIEVGEVVVYKVEGKEVPIVHRVMKVHTESETNKQYLLTKGDNNSADDRGLYNPGQLWIQRDDIIGRVKGFVPYAGMGTIWMNDYPQLKMGLLGTLCILSLFSND